LIPKDNPFVGRPEVRPEIWAYGLRNPWRFSFDKEGHAIVGDVGQEGREELDLVSKGDNLGWNVREGSICGQGITDCVKPEMTDPIFEYDRTVGECIIGGETATGTRIAEIQGKYIFADFVRGRIWAIDLPPKAPKAGEAWTPLVPKVLGQWGKLFTSFAHDNDGNLYVTDVVAGEVLALMPAP
jgi:glucose/arabinose dehydrogenase